VKSALGREIHVDPFRPHVPVLHGVAHDAAQKSRMSACFPRQNLVGASIGGRVVVKDTAVAVDLQKIEPAGLGVDSECFFVIS